MDGKGKVVIEKQNGKWAQCGGEWGNEIMDDGRYQKDRELEVKCVVDGRKVPEEEEHKGSVR